MDRNSRSERPHWSASQLNQFLNVCSLQYYFERIARLEPECVSANVLFGRAVHNAIGYFYQHMREGRRVGPDEVASVFREDWDLATSLAGSAVIYSNGQDHDGLSDLGARLAAHFAEQAWDEEIVSVEEYFEVPLVAADGTALPQPLVGYFDLVTRDAEGTLAVVDIKTASRRYTQHHVDQDLQATCYCYAISHRTSDEEVLFCWDVLLKTRTPQRERYYTTRNADDFDRLVWLVQIVDRAVRAGVFVPNQESSFCAGCGFRTACQGWHRRSSRAVVEMRTAT